MDSLGIEINEGSWSVVHLWSTLFNIRLESNVRFSGASDEERLDELKAYIKSRGIKDPCVAVGLPRGSVISRVLEIPAPAPSVVDGILKYELEKHIPFGLEETYYGHQVLKREKNIFSVFLAAAMKETVDGIAGRFGSAGFNPVVVGVWQESIFNALYYVKKLLPEKNVAAITVSDGRVNIDVFSNLYPVYSKSIEAGGLKPEDYVEILKRDLRLSLSSDGVKDGKLDEAVVISESAPEDGFLKALADSTGVPVSFLKLDELNIPSSAAPAFGLALMAAGKAKLNINLAPNRADVQSSHRQTYTTALAGLAAVLLIFVGASYLIRDTVAIKRLESAISETRAKKEKVESLFGTLKVLDERVKALDEIKGSYPSTGLDVLKELTELLPNDTWLTGFEYSNGLAVIDGFSDRSSSLILKMENSRLLKDMEFTGPVTKSSNGKEHFKIKFSVSAK